MTEGGRSGLRICLEEAYPNAEQLRLCDSSSTILAPNTAGLSPRCDSRNAAELLLDNQDEPVYANVLEKTDDDGKTIRHLDDDVVTRCDLH